MQFSYIFGFKYSTQECFSAVILSLSSIAAVTLTIHQGSGIYDTYNLPANTGFYMAKFNEIFHQSLLKQFNRSVWAETESSHLGILGHRKITHYWRKNGGFLHNSIVNGPNKDYLSKILAVVVK